MKSKIVTMDFKKLNAFVKETLKGYYVDVGIMGKKVNREGGGQTNAEIGFIHEFGTSKIPKRSFLRMPLFTKTEQILEQVREAGALKKLGAGKVVEVLSDLGIACEAAIGDAFDSGGFGDWAENAPSTIRRKKSSSPLIDTGQLRRSIASVVGHI